MNGAVYQKILYRLQQKGFDISKLQMTKQL
jgi:hypothetical protein